MGCQSDVYIGHYLTFSIATHDPDTGALTDADANPTYRIYEDETAVPILTGTMAILDDVNTTGFYTERIECSAANGFENGKSYTIFIRAVVDSDPGGITFGFRALTAPNNLSAAQVKGKMVDGLNGDTYALPGQGALPAIASIAAMITYLYKFARNKITQTDDIARVYDDAGATTDHKANVTDDGTIYTRGKFGSGP